MKCIQSTLQWCCNRADIGILISKWNNYNDHTDHQRKWKKNLLTLHSRFFALKQQSRRLSIMSVKVWNFNTLCLIFMLLYNIVSLSCVVSSTMNKCTPNSHYFWSLKIGDTLVGVALPGIMETLNGWLILVISLPFQLAVSWYMSSKISTVCEFSGFYILRHCSEHKSQSNCPLFLLGLMILWNKNKQKNIVILQYWKTRPNCTLRIRFFFF